MPRTSLLLALLLALPAQAAPAEGDDDEDPPTDTGAADAADDAIWSWIERLDGEAPTAELVQAVEEAVAVDLDEQAFLQRIHGLDIPDDYYRDPRRVLLGDPLHLAKVDPSEFDIPVVVNAQVERWIAYLTGPGRKYFKRWLERKGRYEALIQREIEAAGLPQDLIFLSMIESGFNAHAYSHAHAAGLWQFIPSTARMYGLDVDFWVDDRRDPEMSTKAALKMLGDLHRQFGDWYLAFAAYNTGPGRVRRALSRAGPGADYWDLWEQDLLHPETKGYVPKILAAAIIGHHPERYGFDDLEPHAPLAYDAVVVEGAVDLDVLARCAGIDEEALRLLNPALRRYATPAGRTELRVPPGRAAGFLAALAEVPPSERQKVLMHAVARGESLSMIAGRYGVSANDVVRANRLSDPNRLYVGQKLVIPAAGRVAVVQSKPAPAAAGQAASKPASKSPGPATYTVRSGDALSTIAERHGVALADVQAWNGLRDPSHIQVGQVLRLTAPGSASAEGTAGPVRRYTVQPGDTLSAVAERHGVRTSDLQAWNDLRDASTIRVGQELVIRGGAAPTAGATTLRYTVRPGDTLSGVAARHGVTTRDLVAWNRLEDASSLQAGQVLRIQQPADAWTTHVVRSGESLGIIAARYGVSVSDLKAWNALRSSTIYPGDELKVRRR